MISLIVSVLIMLAVADLLPPGRLDLERRQRFRHQLHEAVAGHERRSREQHCRDAAEVR